ncbi:MAG: His/Gly/Thr/Pro-type tRNA ligase C-terminal domain-containing protein, partial [Clostridiales bacterium]
VPVNDKDEYLVKQAESLYEELQRRRVEVLIDDRKERPGVKFNDADLLGFPIRVTLGKRCRESGMAEIKLRATGEMIETPLPEVADRLQSLIRQLLAEVGC